MQFHHLMSDITPQPFPEHQSTHSKKTQNEKPQAYSNLATEVAK
jgi:hypothetical protein